MPVDKTYISDFTVEDLDRILKDIKFETGPGKTSIMCGRAFLEFIYETLGRGKFILFLNTTNIYTTEEGENFINSVIK